MSERAFVDFGVARMGAGPGARLLRTHALPGMVMLASSALLGVWVVYSRQIPTPQPPTASQGADTKLYGELTAPSIDGRLSTVVPTSADTIATENTAPYVGTFPPDPFGTLSALGPSATVALRPSLDLDMEIAPPLAQSQVAAAPPPNAPLPPRRPVGFGVAPGPAASPAPSLAVRETPAPTPAAPGFFERLFGVVKSTQGQAVAYANPETTTVSRSTPQSSILRSVAPWGQPSGLARYDKFTAVYDIEAKTVYLPNGSRLEAHSGLGDLKDDPKHVDAHARGATPPDVYELGLREGLFHGVQALRLKPVGSGEQFGRTGLLAHPYMLGAEGDSFGCVSFKDYDAFLQAFQSGQVRKLAVVAKLD